MPVSHLSRALVACVALSCLATPLLPQNPTPAPAAVSTAAAAEGDAIRKLTWRSIGPANNAGRISVVAGVPGDPSTYYVAGAAGGIAKTTNGGTTFRQIFDNQNVLSVGAIAIAPSDPNIIYVGSGEGDPRNSTSFGDGMYKSLDAGNTWTHIGLDDADRIKRVVIDPKNPDIVYACALGHAWGPNEERGVFKTTDGGKTWKKQLYRNNTTGCSDLDIDPTNSNIVYAGMYTFRRWAWIFESGAGETAVYKSIDGGATWKKLTRGLPTEPMDRIGIAVSRSEPNIVYVVSETKTQGELWRSDDAGETFRVVNRDPNINFRPFYYSDIRVDPQNSNRVFSLSGSLNFSDDGGRTFQTIGQGVHGDHQAMWIDPLNPKRILSGSDGGWQVSMDGGRTWDVVNAVAFTQFYHVNYDMQKPYFVCGGLQDNGHWCGPSNSLSGQGIRKNDWVTISGGDGFFAVPDLERPYLVYSASQGGNLEVTDLRSGMERSIHPYPNRVGSVGDAMESHKYRFNWNSPIVLSPHDPKIVYFGGNVLFKTANFGQTWEQISPDLTTNDKNKQKSSGGQIVVDNTAAEFHCTIISIAPSPVDPNVIWVGTDDGNVQVTRDGGKTWSNVFKNVPGLAPFAWIPMVDASHFDAGTAYVAADHHQDNDYTPYFYKTTDFGKTWTRITNGLPAKGWSHVIREDPKNRNVLYAGTEVGVFASWNGGAKWVSIRNGLPPVPVRDLLIHKRDNDIILATHGRGMYILDDATPIQQLAQAQSSDVYLFDIPSATRWVSWNRDGNLGSRSYAGQNPPAGAMFSYFLRAGLSTSPTITIADKAGKVVRTLRNLPRDSGVNRTTWDLRMDTPPALAAGGGRGGGRGAGAAPAAPAGEPGEAGPGEGRGGGRFGGGGGINVLPGDYTVTLVAGDKRLTKSLHVESDPRVKVTDAELVAQYDASTSMQALSVRVAQVVSQVDDITRQLTALSEQLRPAAGGGGRGMGVAQQGEAMTAAYAAVSAAMTKLKAFRDDELTRPLAGLGYRQYPRLREEVQTLSGMIGRASAPPTDPQTLRAKELEAETTQAEAKLQAIINDDIKKVNSLLTGMPHVITPAAQKIVP